MAKIKEYELSMEQMKVEGKRVEGEQKRKYLEEESKQQKYKAEYQVKVMFSNHKNRHHLSIFHSTP